jgi:hypothetical protein
MESSKKYSIIIPYRDRKAHLERLLPRLIEVFDNFYDENYEIIISEQDNNENFQIAAVENIGFKYSSGNVIVLHQVDYYPTYNVSYDIEDQPILPARKAIFLDKDHSTPRPLEDVPGGYRRFHEEVDYNFYGGVVAMLREHFELINGINPMYKGWGNEDEDLRERFKWAGLKPTRKSEGTFYCLYHEDNGDMSRKAIRHAQDFYEGRRIFSKAYEYRHIGYKNLKYKITDFKEIEDKILWIKSTDYKIEM